VIEEVVLSEVKPEVKPEVIVTDTEKQEVEPVCRQLSSEKENFGFSSSLEKKPVGTSMSATRMVRRSSG